MRHRTHLRTALQWLAIPAGLLAGSVYLGSHASTRPAAGPPTITDWSAVDDAKLHRTFDVYKTPEETAVLASDTERAVGHAGLRIDIAMTRQQLHYFRTARKDESRVEQEVAIGFDGGPARTALLEVHGWSTQSTDRKSFMVRLFKSQRLTADCVVHKFILLNMMYDKGAFRMEYCGRLLHGLGLYPSYHEYVTVFLNGHPEGIYLLVERPEDAIRRAHPDAVTVLRRRWAEVAEVKYAAPRYDPLLTYKALQHLPAGEHGAALAASVDAVLDLDRYMKWLAFNSLVRNCDFGDELFLYELPTAGGHGRLEPVAWDYDDLFKPPAHPKQALRDSLLYACEAHIDRLIEADPVLYERFARVMQDLLTSTLTADALSRTLADVRATLNPIDSGLPAEMDTGQRQTRAAEMERFESLLLARRRELLHVLSHELPAGVSDSDL